MRVIEPYQFRRPLRKKRSVRGFVLFILIILLAAYGAAAFAKPLPGISGETVALRSAVNNDTTLKWPSTGQAAFGAVGYGVLAQSGAQTTAPMASIAKVMMAMAVLEAKPLKLGDKGPSIVINESDIQTYNQYVAQGGSVVPVNFGESLTEYQALQALLLPSANNIADTLGRWAFGSTDAYLRRANDIVASLQLKQTHIADSSGFSELTTSTPHDLVLLGIAALANPVMAEIVQQQTASIPVAGEVINTNKLLGQNGISGIKTGHTEQSGGCLLFSSVQPYPNGQKLTLVGAVMGTPSSVQAESDSAALLRTAIPGFRVITAIRSQAIVGNYKTSWASSAAAVVGEDVNVLAWSAVPPRLKVNLDELKVPARKGAVVGSLTIETSGTIKTMPITLRDKLDAPSAIWRFAHLF